MSDEETKAQETTEGPTAKRRRRKGESRQGPAYKIEANHYLRTLVDAGVCVKVSMLGGEKLGSLTGKLVGFDPYSYFVEKDGVIYLVHKGAARYLVPVDGGNARPQNGD